MDNLFSSNSYYLLGLPVSSSQYDIKKQARLITAKLGIGEGNLNSDLDHLKADRTEDTVSEALQRLSSPPKKIQDVYFWYTDDSPEVIKLIKKESLEEVYFLLSKKADKDGKWNDKRNLAIFITQLLQYKKTYKKYLIESLELWKNITESESSLKYFELYYKNIDDLDTDSSVFPSLRDYVNKEISDIYSGLSKKWEDKEYIQSYTRVFNRMGSSTEKDVFEPSVIEINDACKKLHSISWAKDEPSKENLKDIKEAIVAIQKSLNLLIENGIYGGPAITLRDKAAECVRGVGTKLYNDYLDYEKGSRIIEIANQIAGTTSLKSQLKEDIATAKETKDTELVILPILELSKDQNWIEALELTNKLIKKHSGDEKILKILNQQKKGLITRYASDKHSEALSKLNKGKRLDCKQDLIELQEFLLERLDIFTINKKWLDEIKEAIYQGTARIDRNQVNVLDTYRSKLIKDSQAAFGENEETTVAIVLIDTFLYVPLCDYFEKLHSRAQTVNILTWLFYLTVLYYGLGLIFLLVIYVIQRNEVVYVRES